MVALKKAIEEGFDSGLVINFHAKEHLEKLKAGKQQNGLLCFTNRTEEDLSEIWECTFEVWSETRLIDSITCLSIPARNWPMKKYLAKIIVKWERIF